MLSVPRFFQSGIMGNFEWGQSMFRSTPKTWSVPERFLKARFMRNIKTSWERHKEIVALEADKWGRPLLGIFRKRAVSRYPLLRVDHK
ncbi:hypothetical protein EMIT0P265_90001 [Pseudomonas zeae]